MNKYIIIVAGGSGQRMNSDIPKQFLLLNGIPVLMHTLQKFYDHDASNNIIVVLPLNQADHWKQLCIAHHFNIPHILATGGNTRFDSVKSGLKLIPAEEQALVAVHDGVRPLVSKQVIENCFKKAAEYGSAIPVIACNDSVRIIAGNESKIADRDTIKLVQTPQVFKNTILQSAYNVAYIPEFTDDASVIEKKGNKIFLIEGNPENIKITTPMDLLIAEKLLTLTR